MVSGIIQIIPNEIKYSKQNKKSSRSSSSDDSYRIDLKGSGHQGNILRNLFYNSNDKFNEFIKSSFKNNPVVLKGNDDRIVLIKELLFDLDVQSLLENTASDQIHIWLSQGKEGPLQSITTESAIDAFKLYQAGHSIYCRAPLELEKIVIPSVMKEIGMGINCNHNDRFKRGEIETFFSRKGHITDFHTDFQENFTIQLSGKKKWIFSDSTITSPLRGCTPHFSAKNNNDLVEQQLKVLKLGNNSFSANEYKSNNNNAIELSPGDILYHPAGIWHRVECIEDSISINISLTASSYAEVFCNNLQQILLENNNWRSPVFSNNTSSQSVFQSIIDSLPNILKNITSNDILSNPLIHNNNNNNTNNMKNLNNENDNNEEEEEEEDDESPKDYIIIVSQIDLLSNSLYSQISKQNKEQKKFPQILKNLLFKFNPTAIIISDNEVILGGGSEYTDDDSIDVYIIHNGFGNETLESTNRMEIHIENQIIKDYMIIIMDMYKKFSELKYNIINNNNIDNSSKFSDVDFTIYDLIKNQVVNNKPTTGIKRKNNDNNNSNINDTFELVAKLTIALYSAGLISLK